MEPNWNHKTVFTGDNLYVMRGMNSESVDLIYLDPPFNSNRAYAAPIGSEAAGAAFKDTWTLSDVDLVEHNRLKEESVGLYALLESSRHIHSKGMFSYLVMMAVRLVEMRRLLKPTGSIYLHCDPTANSYLRLVMDATFGHGNFRNEVVWERSAGRSDTKAYGRVHDLLYYYTKTDRFAWNQQYISLSDEYVKMAYRYEDCRGKYSTSPLLGSGVSGRTYSFNWRGIESDKWRFSYKSLDELESKDLIHWSKNGRPRRKMYLVDSKGVAVRDVVTDITRETLKERTGYPTQKPLALLKRIIRASSNEGDVVLDPFCGCATTMVAADDLGRNWVGIDISPKAVELVRSRIEDRQGLFRDITHREDVPRRTDMGEELKGKGKDEYRKTLYGLQDGNCNGCHVHFQTAFLEIDHIMPRAKGGTDHAENFQLLCRPCNSLKGTKSQAEFKVLLAEKKGINTSWI